MHLRPPPLPHSSRYLDQSADGRVSHAGQGQWMRYRLRVSEL